MWPNLQQHTGTHRSFRERSVNSLWRRIRSWPCARDSDLSSTCFMVEDIEMICCAVALLKQSHNIQFYKKKKKNKHGFSHCFHLHARAPPASVLVPGRADKTVKINVLSLRNSLVDRCPRPAKTASVQQNTCLCWSERPAISFFFFFFQIHIAQILFKTHFKVQNSLVI